MMERVIEENDGLICTCGYDLRVTGHCACGQVFQKCLGCGLPTKMNRCTCPEKKPNPNYPEEWN